ncbi:MAG: type II secretion system major pseudopilin GspG [Candidatus Omnitrophica bacterium]|nr:type II secretion system major pseudopilin GspG [Candidatus Omnitrophota bacterium]
MLRNQKGFTLIELTLVVLIIAALAAMVGPRLVGRAEDARVAAAQADIKSNLSTVLDLYEMDNGSYPESLVHLWQNPGSDRASKWRGPYLKKKSPRDPWGNEYQYRSPGEHNTEDYDLYSMGPDGEVSEDDITNWEEEAGEAVD